MSEASPGVAPDGAFLSSGTKARLQTFCCLGDGASRATEVDMAKKSETGSSLGEYARVVGELNGAEEESTPAKQAEADAQSETSPSGEELVEGQDQQPPAGSGPSGGETS
jgi:hypothetical protein